METIKSILENVLQTDNGICYRNLDAWHNNQGVIYVGEYQLDDLGNGEVAYNDLWTKTSWLCYVKDYILYARENGEIGYTDEFAEIIAYDVLYNADWSDLSTLLLEYDLVEMWEQYLDDKKIYRKNK